MDRRVKKTKSQLKNGLAVLMKTKRIGEITVKELVEMVDINRSTFYLHYSDIPGLLQEIEDELAEEVSRAVEKRSMFMSGDGTPYFIRELFRVMDQNREIISALLGPYGDLSFVHRLARILEENSREELEEMFPGKEDKMQYLYAYCFNGCLGFVKAWLETEGQTWEYAAEFVHHMLLGSVEAFRETDAP